VLIRLSERKNIVCPHCSHSLFPRKKPGTSFAAMCREPYLRIRLFSAKPAILDAFRNRRYTIFRKGGIGLLELFLTFMKIGLFTFGGGYAMISLIEDICVDQKKWITHDQMMNVTIVAESTPGPIAINCATYVGWLRFGFSGSVAATLGVVIPSFVIIYIISMFLDNFLEFTVIANAFRGIKLAVGLLILNAGINMLRKMKKTGLSLAILVCAALIILLVPDFSSLSLMLIAGVLSLSLSFQKGGRP